MQEITVTPIARIRSDFPSKFGIPRQSGLVKELRATIVFEPEFRNADALRGMEDFSHLWLIWQFSEAVRTGWSPTVRPPGWAEIPGWVFLPPDPLSGPIIWVCPASGSWDWSRPGNLAP